MEEILKEMKELLNKEMTLLEIDNKFRKILQSNESVYNYLEDALEQKEFAYTYGQAIKELAHKAIVVKFDVLDNNPNKFWNKYNMKIKVTGIKEV